MWKQFLLDAIQFQHSRISTQISFLQVVQIYMKMSFEQETLDHKKKEKIKAETSVVEMDRTELNHLHKRNYNFPAVFSKLTK